MQYKTIPYARLITYFTKHPLQLQDVETLMCKHRGHAFHLGMFITENAGCMPIFDAFIVLAIDVHVVGLLRCECNRGNLISARHVDTDYRRRGIMSSMLYRLPAGTYQLDVLRSNVQAVSGYQKMGFKKVYKKDDLEYKMKWAKPV